MDKDNFIGRWVVVFNSTKSFGSVLTTVKMVSEFEEVMGSICD